MIISRPLSLLGLLLAAAPSHSLADEPLNQADVYNTLYDAHVQCDEDLDQSRTEFITDELERNGANRLSMELLTTLLAYNLQSAMQSISDKTEERERYVAEMLRAPKMSVDESVEEAEASSDRHEKIRQIDAFLKRERRYVAVRECVLETLDKAPE
jgi:hypothetical protein